MQIDVAMSEVVRRSGRWIACRPGCAECCLGEFEISLAEAALLREGLRSIDAERATGVRERARQLNSDEDAPCPALDPETRECDLYAWRPVTCRVFGPATRSEDDPSAIGACELCYVGATDAEIEACAVTLPAADPAVTTVAIALLQG
ncbi:MAG: YkgJ family cysteine cluster protein [Bryobacterales bacterium]|nr:YkgJ family cysteine cluster protein [Bryobacterales bacterium]